MKYEQTADEGGSECEQQMIASEQQVLSLLRAKYSSRPRRYYGFFSSVLNRIVTQEHLMLLPMDDRTATRAHGVFDVFYVRGRRAINLHAHLDRLYASAASVAIVPPYSRADVTAHVLQVVSEVVNYHQIQEEVGVRITLSSGWGDLGIASLVRPSLTQNKQSVLYMVVFQPYISYAKEKLGVKEFVVREVDKPKELVHSKTIDYIENALMANASKVELYVFRRRVGIRE